MRINILRALYIPGWMSHNELLWLARTAQRCSSILEVGSCKGRSSRALADHLPEHGILVCVDPWNGEYFKYDSSLSDYMHKEDFIAFQYNLKDHIEAEKVVVLKEKFETFRSLNRFDLIFLDGDHRYEEVKKDISKARKLVRPYGIIAGHDYNQSTWPGVKQAVEEEFKEFNTMETIWWTTKF